MKITTNPADFVGHLPVFAGPAYLSSRSDRFGWLTDGSFALPFYVDRRFVFRRLVLTNECVSLGENADRSEAEFLGAALEMVRRELGVDFVAKPQANAVFGEVPAEWESVEWGSYVVPLDRDEEELLAGIQARTRTSIRKARRLGVAVEKTADLGTVHRLLKGTMDRQRQPFTPSMSFLERVASCDPEIMTCYVVKHEGEAQGCAVIFHNQLGAYYYYGGSIPSPAAGAIAFLHYRIMVDLRDMGVPTYDLMGARLTLEAGSKMLGIQRFKSHLGATLRTGYSFRYILRPLRYKMFLAMAKLYLELKGYSFNGDAIDEIRSIKNPIPAPGLDTIETEGGG